MLRRVVVAGLFLGVAVGGVAWWANRPRPRLVIAQELPADVQRLVDDTWSSFLDRFPAQRRCLGQVGLVLVDDVEDGDASYRRSERLIRIEIPTSPRRFPQNLAHELGHHLAETCDVDGAMVAEVAHLQGLDDEITEWADDPLEHFADTVVELVVGDRSIHLGDIGIDDATADAVAGWGRGS